MPLYQGGVPFDRDIVFLETLQNGLVPEISGITGLEVDWFYVAIVFVFILKFFSPLQACRKIIRIRKVETVLQVLLQVWNQFVSWSTRLSLLHLLIRSIFRERTRPIRRHHCVKLDLCHLVNAAIFYDIWPKLYFGYLSRLSHFFDDAKVFLVV